MSSYYWSQQSTFKIQSLQKWWSEFRTCKGTQQIHYLTANGSYSVTNSRVSLGMPISTHSFLRSADSASTIDTTRMSQTINAENTECTVFRPGDFVVIKFNGKKSIKLLLGLVNSVDDTENKYQFFRRLKSTTGVFAVKDSDVSWVDKDAITQVLECPIINTRGQYCLTEKLDFLE